MLVAATRRLRLRRARSWRARREAESFISACRGVLGDDRRVGLVSQPGLDEAVEGAVALEGGDGLVHAADERIVEVEQQAELVTGGGRELADDRSALDLDGGNVEGGREVDDDRVDLLGLESSLGAGVVLVDEGLGIRLDDLVDEVEARGGRLGAELDALQVGDRLRSRGGGTGKTDNGLVGHVVGVTEGDRLLALLGDRVLLQVEVEVLGAGLDRLVEPGAHPGHVRIGEPESTRDRVCDGGFEALLRLRLVVLDPRAVRRVAGGDGELAFGERLAGSALVAGAGPGVRGRGSCV